MFLPFNLLNHILSYVYLCGEITYEEQPVQCCQAYSVFLFGQRIILYVYINSVFPFQMPRHYQKKLGPRGKRNYDDSFLQRAVAAVKQTKIDDEGSR